MRNAILNGDVREMLRSLPAESVHCVVTSPPYWGLRDYGTAQWEGGDPSHEHRGSVERTAAPGSAKQASSTGANYVASGDCACGAHRIDSQLGLEATPEEYVANMVEVFREVRRVLRSDGCAWVNLGDSYWNGGGVKRDGGHDFVDGGKPKLLAAKGALPQPRSSTELALKPKDLCGIPWRVAFALQADGWWLRSDIIWSKPNPMPESVADRPTKAHEYLFLLSKSQTYFYDAEAIKEVAVEGNDLGLLRGKFGTDGVFVAWHAPSIEKRQQAGVDSRTAGTGRRNKRTVWEIATEPYSEAHFATYPTELVKPCILAGTSEHGCCSVCGAPWERVVERHSEETLRLPAGKALTSPRNDGSTWNENDGRGFMPVETRTTGWRPTCKHVAPVVPALVLDPFGGSGTTGLVAKTAGRDYVLIELNPEYVEMAKKRVNVGQERLL